VYFTVGGLLKHYIMGAFTVGGLLYSDAQNRCFCCTFVVVVVVVVVFVVVVVVVALLSHGRL